MTTSATSTDDGPSLGNTQSQWTPRFQAPHIRANTTGATEPFVEDETENAGAQAQDALADSPTMQPSSRAPANRGLSGGYPQRMRAMLASAEYTPQWQRSQRMATGNPPGAARRVAFNGQPTRRVAQAGAPGLGGPGPGGPATSPFVEDEIVPQGTRLPAPDGEVQYQNEQAFDGIADGTVVDGDGDGCNPSCDPSCDPCCDGFNNCCDPCYDPTQWDRFHVCSPVGFLNELAFNSGVQAFKSPVDNGRNSNFGAHTGINAGDSLWHRWGIGYQVGAQFIESNFYGDQSALTYQPGSRRQGFVTAGLFHRAFYNCGLQGGVVFDYLDDKYYYNASLAQLRAELSYLFYGGHEFGAWVAAHDRSSQFTFLGANRTLQPINLYTLFYRRTFANGTQGRVWAGFTGPVNVDGSNGFASAILGADYRIVLSNRWDFAGVVNYLPSTQGNSSGQQAESWAISMNLVFYPMRYARGVHNGPYRPLFNIADNTMFIVNRK
jgi:hypothetical protein